jgi:chromosome segregation ATPase
MSDDLVKRLRYGVGYWPETGQEAADRIEELQRERDEALNQLDSARHSVDILEKRVEFVDGERRKTFQALLRVTKIHDEVEIKLAKAVEALDEAWFMLTVPCLNYEPEPEEPGLRRIKTALAELKGKTDD